MLQVHWDVGEDFEQFLQADLFQAWEMIRSDLFLLYLEGNLSWDQRHRKNLRRVALLSGQHLDHYHRTAPEEDDQQNLVFCCSGDHTWLFHDIFDPLTWDASGTLVCSRRECCDVVLKDDIEVQTDRPLEQQNLSVIEERCGRTPRMLWRDHPGWNLLSVVEWMSSGVYRCAWSVVKPGLPYYWLSAGCWGGWAFTVTLPTHLLLSILPVY